MFKSSNPFDLPTHTTIDPKHGITATFAYDNPSPFRTAKQSLEIILNNKDSKQIFYFLLLNLCYMFVQLAYGVWTNSLGLISDAVHMFFDCLALGVGLFASVMSQWPSDSEYSYGYSRIETVAAYFNGIFLVLISISIVTEAIQRLIDPPHMNTHRLLFVSFIGLVVNLIGIFAFNHGHSHAGHDHHHHHHDGHSANMKGVFLHIMADTLGSVGVIASTILIKWFGWTGFDPIASIFIAVLITASVIPLIKQSSAIMMLELDDETVAMIEGTLEEVRRLEGVVGITKPRFWPHEAESIIGSVHVQIKDDSVSQVMRQRITELFKSHIHGLKEVCVQIELQSTMKQKKSLSFFGTGAPRNFFYHTPAYTGISSMNDAYVNHRPVMSGIVPNIGTNSSPSSSSPYNHQSSPQTIDNKYSPSPNLQQQPSSLTTTDNPSSSNTNVMSVLQKQNKKE